MKKKKDNCIVPFMLIANDMTAFHSK